MWAGLVSSEASPPLVDGPSVSSCGLPSASTFPLLVRTVVTLAEVPP